MLLELVKPVALFLCLLSLLMVFHTVFFTLEDPHLLHQPHQALNDRILDSLLLLALSAGISLMGSLVFREAEPLPRPSLSSTLPLQIFYWATSIMLLLYPLASFLETHYIFTPAIHW
ncbi:hypothetical protein RBB79_03845 [Tunturiibacter empetritectus]|uniref:Uncharacterized protein n=1 Tax=Tunturiibacter lichenicola TaxID=2051959 RepID=A0A852VB40_9BACT|nr:hypothetical protein [Edaphobacter lichenicola]NYF88647.1 hypothetical protein [Edaphobacter lichenicola]